MVMGLLTPTRLIHILVLDLYTVTLTATAAGTSNALGWRGTASQSVQIDLPTYERD